MLIAKAVKLKGVDFKFHVPRDSPDMTPYKISVKGSWSVA